MKMLERFFKLKENNTDVKTELMAGFATFLSMIYIFAVNPKILSVSGMDPAAVFTATAVSAGLATILMAFWANYPVALASGMGLNAYFAYTVCGKLAEMGIEDPWKVALTAVFIEGIIFIILSFFKFRETLVNKIPKNIKYGITVGIGLYIAFIGMKGSGIIVPSDVTLVTLGNIGTPQVLLSLIGFLTVIIMHHYKVLGGVLWAILITWGLGIIAQMSGWYVIDVNAGANSLLPDFSQGFTPTAPNFFQFNFHFAATNIIQFATIVFSFLFVDLFDTVGTLIGVGYKAGLMDENDELPKVSQALLTDATGTIIGSCLGTSTVTSYAESTVGIANGGRTGLTALSTGILFLLALFLSPFFLAIPSFATTPALMYVGLMMITTVKKMDFEEDMAAAVSGFFAIIMMPFTYSIENGIMFAMLSYVIIRILQGKAKDVHWIMWVSAGIFALRIFLMISQGV